MAAGKPRRKHGGTAVKIVVTGPFSAGKTTLIRTISEITVLSTEKDITDHTRSRKAETTVAMDFGRITIDRDLVLYLFGTPGQDRFWFIWDELSRGAVGAIVLVETRRLDTSFAAVDYFERRGTPFVVAVNCFEGAQQFDLAEIQMALNLGPNVPVMLCDARSLASCKKVLIDLVLHAMKMRGLVPETQNV